MDPSIQRPAKAPEDGDRSSGTGREFGSPSGPGKARARAVMQLPRELQPVTRCAEKAPGQPVGVRDHDGRSARCRPRPPGGSQGGDGISDVVQGMAAPNQIPAIMWLRRILDGAQDHGIAAGAVHRRNGLGTGFRTCASAPASRSADANARCRHPHRACARPRRSDPAARRPARPVRWLASTDVHVRYGARRRRRSTLADHHDRHTAGRSSGTRQPGHPVPDR
jgi:hypothetical protein